jgi:hypothetical protein
MSAEPRFAQQRAEIHKRFSELDVAQRRALLAVDDGRIVNRVYGAVQTLATCARLCEETNLPNGIANADDLAPVAFEGHLFDCFGCHWQFGETDIPNVVVVRSDLSPVMRPKIPWLEEPTRFLEFVERFLPDFCASPHRTLRPQATWWRLMNKEPSNWAALDRALALLLEQHFLSMLAGETPKAALADDSDIVADLEKSEKKKAKKKAKKKKKAKGDAETAELDDVDELGISETADDSPHVQPPEVSEAPAQAASNASTPRTSPSVKSGKSEKTAATESGISSEAGRSLDFTSTEGVSTRRSPPTNPEMTPDATARADGATDVNVSPHRFVSMMVGALAGGRPKPTGGAGRLRQSSR